MAQRETLQRKGDKGKGACPERGNMLKWLQRPSQNQPPAPDATLPEGWFAPQSAEQLLATPLRAFCEPDKKLFKKLATRLFCYFIEGME